MTQRSYHLPLAITGPARGTVASSVLPSAAAGFDFGPPRNWSCYIRGGEAQGIYHRCSTLSIRSLSLSLSCILGGFLDRRFTPFLVLGVSLV